MKKIRTSVLLILNLIQQDVFRKIIYTVFLLFKRPQWSLVFLLGRFQLIRVLYSNLLDNFSKLEKSSRFDSSLPFSHVDIKSIVKTLQADGIFVGFSLPQNILEDILNYTYHYYCFAGGRANLGFKILEKERFQAEFGQSFYTARYFNISLDCPAILELAHDPVLQEIATQYIGSAAKYTGASLFWTFPTEGSIYDPDQQKFTKFHYDLDDFASLRFCFYLTKVTLDDGPHICIRGSHKRKSLFHVLNYMSRIQSE